MKSNRNNFLKILINNTKDKKISLNNTNTIKNITLFGSCRINGINNNNNLNNLINYTHSTKEIIQQIHFLLGNISFPSPFDKLYFRTGICENKPIIYDNNYNKLFNDSTVCIIEICSDKKYIYDNYLMTLLFV